MREFAASVMKLLNGCPRCCTDSAAISSSCGTSIIRGFIAAKASTDLGRRRRIADATAALAEHLSAAE